MWLNFAPCSTQVPCEKSLSCLVSAASQCSDISKLHLNSPSSSYTSPHLILASPTAAPVCARDWTHAWREGCGNWGAEGSAAEILHSLGWIPVIISTLEVMLDTWALGLRVTERSILYLIESMLVNFSFFSFFSFLAPSWSGILSYSCTTQDHHANAQLCTHKYPAGKQK